jgi:hypothetical protein
MTLKIAAAAAAFLALSAGAVLAADACVCCKDMEPGATMDCCDEMNAPPPSPGAAPDPAPDPTPRPEAPQRDGHAGQMPG